MSKFFKKIYKYTPLGWYTKGLKKLGWKSPDNLMENYLDEATDAQIALQIATGLAGAAATSGLFGSQSKSRSDKDFVNGYDEYDDGEYDPSMDEDVPGSSVKSTSTISKLLKSLGIDSSALGKVLLSGGATTAAIESQNKYNRDAATTAYNRQEEFYNNHLSMQAKVAEYQAAGLNPMTLTGAGAGATSAPSVEQAAPSGLNATDMLGTLLNYKARMKEIAVQDKRANIEASRVSLLEEELPAKIEQYLANAEERRKRVEVHNSVIALNSKTLDFIDARISKVYAEVDNIDAKTFLLNIQGKYADESERARVANLWKDLKVKDSTISRNDAAAALDWSQKNLTDITAKHQGALMDAETEAAWSRAAVNYADEAVKNFEVWYKETHNGSAPPTGIVGALQGICASISNQIATSFGFASVGVR